MDLNQAKAFVLEELNEIDPEQLEYLCEEVIREVEEPESLEVTPFRRDKGIDIRGSTGHTIFRGDFGVQVKQTDSRVGSPTVQRFGGALDVDGAGFGVFITTSEFTKPARADVNETDEFAIELISGPRLAEIMVDHELGVVRQSNENEVYAEEYDFWGKFEVDEDLIRSGMVPQADSLDVLQQTVIGVSKGHQFKPEIAKWLTERFEKDYSPRQGDYYAIAAHALGLLARDTGEYEVHGTEREVRKWELSPGGREYVHLCQDDPDESWKYLYGQIQELEIMRIVIETIENEIAIVESEIGNLIRENTAVSGSTADRRAKTLGKWLDQTDLPIKRMEGGNQIKYAHQPGLDYDFS
jgi:restriction system protein